MKSWRTIGTVAAVSLCAGLVWATGPRATRSQQSSATPQTLSIEEYQPKSTLVTKEHKLERAKFPFIDIHSHHWNPTPEHVDQLVKEMDTINLRVLVNLSGGTGDDLKKTVATMKGRYPDRFVVFANPSYDDINTPGYGQRAAERLADLGGTGDDLKKTVATMKGRYPDRFVVFANPSYDDINTPGYGQRAAERLAEDVRNGAQGLKIFKNFGMDLKYANGERVHADDPIFDPLFDKCAELKIPVLIHIAEPSAFFDPWDYKNERWEELNEFPQRARPPAKYPSFETLMAERNHLFAKHPRTHFIAAHLAFHGNDLERLGKLFDTLPNMYVDIAAVLAELGRQPYAAHDFLVKYQDRVLMGKDIYDVNEYKWYFRALETRAEYFEY